VHCSIQEPYSQTGENTVTIAPLIHTSMAPNSRAMVSAWIVTTASFLAGIGYGAPEKYLGLFPPTERFRRAEAILLGGFSNISEDFGPSQRTTRSLFRTKVRLGH
jgi:hypothetical protein